MRNLYKIISVKTSFYSKLKLFILVICTFMTEWDLKHDFPNILPIKKLCNKNEIKNFMFTFSLTHNIFKNLLIRIWVLIIFYKINLLYFLVILKYNLNSYIDNIFLKRNHFKVKIL